MKHSLFFQVIFLRARPILNIATRVDNITRLNPNKTTCDEDPSSKFPCFVIQPCFQLLNSPKGRSTFQLRYVIEAESFLESKFFIIFFYLKFESMFTFIIIILHFCFHFSRETDYTSSQVQFS